jgi:hypothetical protein
MNPFVHFSGVRAPRPHSKPANEITGPLPPCILLDVNHRHSIIPTHMHFEGGDVSQ